MLKMSAITDNATAIVGNMYVSFSGGSRVANHSTILLVKVFLFIFSDHLLRLGGSDCPVVVKKVFDFHSVKKCVANGLHFWI
jgi:hypothetical protein